MIVRVDLKPDDNPKTRPTQPVSLAPGRAKGKYQVRV